MDGDRTTTIKPDFHFPVTPSYFAGKGSFSLLPSRDTARFDPRPAPSATFYGAIALLIFHRRPRGLRIGATCRLSPIPGHACKKFNQTTQRTVLSSLVAKATEEDRLHFNDINRHAVLVCELTLGLSRGAVTDAVLVFYLRRSIHAQLRG